MISDYGHLSLEDITSYELSPFPAALFEAKEIFCKADKLQLAQQSLNFQARNKTKLSWILSNQLNIMSLKVTPWFIICHGKGVTVMVLLHCHMPTLPCTIMVKQLYFLMVIVKVLPSKTIHISDVSKMPFRSLASMQKLSLWEEKMISFPDQQTRTY